MAKAKTNTTGSNSVRVADPHSILGTGINMGVAQTVLDQLSSLNSKASEFNSGEMRSRELSYRFVGALCDAAHKMEDDAEFAVGLLNVQKKLGMLAKGVSSIKAVNPYLPLVRVADGAWETVVRNKRLNLVDMQWVPNRSNEKYAGVCRFAVDHDFSGDAMVEHFLSGNHFEVEDEEGEPVEVKATINAIIAYDRKIHNATGTRDVLNDDDWEGILGLKPIADVQFTERLMAALTLSEGGLGFLAYRVQGDRLFLLGDASDESGDGVHREFKNKWLTIRNRNKVAAMAADEPASLPQEYVKVVTE